jgi:hypothetical protein
MPIVRPTHEVCRSSIFFLTLARYILSLDISIYQHQNCQHVISNCTQFETICLPHSSTKSFNGAAWAVAMNQVFKTLDNTQARKNGQDSAISAKF